MVNNDAQLYTIEGIAAAVLMLVTVYLVISSTNLFTPGDSHITDMQLEQIGNDALAIMDTPDDYTETSELSGYIAANDTSAKTAFNASFRKYVNANTTGKLNDLKFNAIVYSYNESSGMVDQLPFGGFPYYHENAVTAKRWVYLPGGFGSGDRNRTVLLEVLLWRD